jgi:hypothetical protein
MADALRTVLVIGDAVCDHNYYRGNRQTADSTEPLGLRGTRSGGGALLLKDIIAEAIKDVSGWTTGLGVSSDYETLPSDYHSHCLWEPQIANPEEKDQKKQFLVWRAVEPALGYGAPASEKGPGPAASTQPAPTAAPRGILVVDDAGLGFRRGPYTRCWPFAESVPESDKPEWVVLKASGANYDGALWQEILKHFTDRLIVIVSADDLRRTDIRIGRGLSWEAVAEDVSAELQGNPIAIPLTKARHIIVVFGSDGAFWFDKQQGSARARLVFDAARAEGEWTPGKGGAFGFLSCVTAAVVRELVRSNEEREKRRKYTPWLDFDGALSAGLSGSRECRRLGHGIVYTDTEQRVVNPTLGFPFSPVAACINDAESEFVGAEVPFQRLSGGDWMMLDEWHGHARRGGRPQPHVQAALAVAIGGPDTLGQFPVARFEALRTVDRQEIESLRTIQQLIRRYEDGGPQTKPLNLAVFGPPGAGKSFGVTQIAKAVLGSKDEDILTINLSQFDDPVDLHGAFHRVRDRVLSGKTPVVFWDEFDSQSYKWLQYLLAPMQDGAFQEGQITHPIGKCVFVFAGATSPTFDEFGPRNPEDEKQQEDFRLKKGPDFKSRIVAYLNVLGPNQRQVWNRDTKRWQDDPKDVCYPIRRALFIRSQFKLKDHQRLRLDMGVVQALLEVPRYKSGARSLEFICRHLREHGSDTPTRSRLPGPQLLDLHVDSKAFRAIYERDADFSAVAPALAPGLHEDFRKSLSEDERTQNKYAVPWSELPADGRAANVAQALRIPRILSVVGLRVRRGSPLPEADEQRMGQTLHDKAELLAEAEHNHWMVERMLAGWRYGRKRDDAKRRHPLLIPYSQLPDDQQEKDRRVVRGEVTVLGYIDRVKEVGFRVEPIPDAE